MADTPRTEADLLALYATTGLGLISAQDGRDLVRTVFGWRDVADPTADNDSADTAGLGVAFSIGSEWINTNSQHEFVCVDDRPGIAVWEPRGGGGASIAYVDAGDAASVVTANAYTDSVAVTTISTANAYTDSVALTTVSTANAYTDSVALATLSSANSFATAADAVVLSSAQSFATAADAVVLSSAQSFATAADAVVLSSAQSFATAADAVVLSSAQSFATAADAVVLSSANSYTDAAIAALPGSLLMESGASSKISDLPAAGTLDGTEPLVAVQSGADVQVTLSAIATYITTLLSIYYLIWGGSVTTGLDSDGYGFSHFFVYLFYCTAYVYGPAGEFVAATGGSFV